MNMNSKIYKTGVIVMMALLTIYVQGAGVQVQKAIAKHNDTKLRSVAAFASEALGQLYTQLKKAGQVDHRVHEAVDIVKDYATGVMFEIPLQDVISQRVGGRLAAPRSFKDIDTNIYMDPFEGMAGKDLIVMMANLDSGGKCRIKVNPRSGYIASVYYYEPSPSDLSASALTVKQYVPHSIIHSYGHTINFGLGMLTVSVSLSPDKKKIMGAITSSKERETVASLQTIKAKRFDIERKKREATKPS